MDAIEDRDDKSSLERLWKHAQGASGQSKIVAKFLLNLFNGMDFGNFDLTDFRGLDKLIFEDCITVLRLENSAHFHAEVHTRLGLSEEMFYRLQETWNFPLRA